MLADGTINQLSLPTTAIEGIGSRISSELERLEIHTVGDLLRVEPGRLHEALPSQRPLEEVRSWGQMAAFLQIRGMTPQWAEALQRAGVIRVSDVRSRDLPGLQKIFTAAKKDRVIPDVPKPALIADMLKEAAIIEFTGALNGTILNENNEPVPNAIVRVGKEEEVSDPRGRFRIIRIPLWARSTLAVSHTDYRPASFRLRQVQPSNFLGGQIFQLKAVPTGRPAPSRLLMEVRGDVLPPVGDGRISLREVEPQQFVERDIFTLTEFSADGERGKLVSKLLVYEEGEFWFPYVWTPLSELKPGAKAGDCFVLRRGAYEEIRMNAVKLRGWPRMLRTRRRMGPPPSDPDEMEEWLNRGAHLMRGVAEKIERF